MIYGYIRVSTKRQENGTSLDDQLRILKQHGCQKIFQDIQSGTTMARPNFEKMLDETEDEIKRGTAKYRTNEEVFSNARRIISEEK